VYKQAAILTLIVAPVLVDLASRAVPAAQEGPPELVREVVVDGQNGQASANMAPRPVMPPQGNPASPNGATPTPMLSTAPTMDTTPQANLTVAPPPAPPPSANAPMPVYSMTNGVVSVAPAPTPIMPPTVRSARY
jgi:hypothetical protein